MLSPVDIRTALTIGTSLASAAAVVATLKSDIRWIKRWMSEHREDDAANFKSVRDEMAALRPLVFNNRPESIR